ncbi:MAG TPA: ABC transporter permease [Gemmatimonadaceae bacterium]|nr:ABC transporter permease [Gemmatimonadaceae bacterium]
MFNLKLALRTLLKTPFVTVVAALSLALGIGANTAIFSIFNQTLRQPLPVMHPEQLANFVVPGPAPGGNSCNQAGDCDEVLSYPMLKDLQKAANSPFSAIVGHRAFDANLAYEKQTPINSRNMLVTGNYFPALGVQPALGRLIGPGDDETFNGNPVAVLGYDFWVNNLGGDPGVLNKQLLVNGEHLTIVGVAPQGFEGTTLGIKPNIYVPMTMAPAMRYSSQKRMENRQSYWVYVFGRMKPGVKLEQATNGINAIYSPIINDVEAPLQKGMSDQTMQKFRAKKIVLKDGALGQSSIHREASVPLMMLFAITGIVLLIACANIANLLLARAANRSMEMAVRLSLGATRAQLLRQLLTESVLLAVIGGMGSLFVANWTIGAILQLMPPEAQGTMHFEMSAIAVWFAAVVSILTGLAFGLFPALHSTRPDLVTALRNNSGKLSGGRGAARFRTSLVTAQVALSMALLISAGLFVKSLYNVSRVDLGLRIDNVIQFSISPRLSGYDSVRAKALFIRAEEELAAIPGVTGVTADLVGLIRGNNWGNDVSVQGFHRDPDTDAGSRFNEIGPGFFKTLGVPMVAGREFTDADLAGRPKVAVVNQAFAKKFNLGTGAEVVGKRMALGDTNDLNIEIVGLVKDSKYSQVKQTIPPVFVLPYRQDTDVGGLNFYVKTAGDPVPMMKSIRATMARLDPNLPLEEFKTLPQQVKENVFLDRMISILSASFALLATILAAVGLYGVLAYSVAQRTREIGVRMALGADSGRVRSMVLRQVGVMIVIGGIIGIAGALALGRGAKSLLYELSGYDPTVIALSVVVLSLVALAAGYVPAMRASKIDPMQALRYE